VNEEGFAKEALMVLVIHVELGVRGEPPDALWLLFREGK
jgi:hypothetical protein